MLPVCELHPDILEDHSFLGSLLIGPALEGQASLGSYFPGDWVEVGVEIESPPKSKVLHLSVGILNRL